MQLLRRPDVKMCPVNDAVLLRRDRCAARHGGKASRIDRNIPLCKTAARGHRTCRPHEHKHRGHGQHTHPQETPIFSMHHPCRLFPIVQPQRVCSVPILHRAHPFPLISMIRRVVDRDHIRTRERMETAECYRVTARRGARDLLDRSL